VALLFVYLAIGAAVAAYAGKSSLMRFYVDHESIWLLVFIKPDQPMINTVLPLLITVLAHTTVLVHTFFEDVLQSKQSKWL
jgi:hypothetical protein